MSQFLSLVGLGRFELPTSPLSGVRSNQLSYRPVEADWWSWSGSNRRPPECKSGALPAELQPLRENLIEADWTLADGHRARATKHNVQNPSGDNRNKWTGTAAVYSSDESDFPQLRPRSLLERR